MTEENQNAQPSNQPADTTQQPADTTQQPATQTQPEATTKPENQQPVTDTSTPEPTKTEPVAGKWPDNWRQDLAGEDEKLGKRLERFATPKDLLTAYRAMEQKLSSGEYKAAKPKEGADEAELKRWREDNGIPESWEKYEVNLSDGLVVGDADKPLVDKFLQSMHAQNASPEHVNAALDTYYKLVSEQQQQMEEVDSSFKTESEDALRAEWGGDFRKNINMINNMLQSAPEGVADSFYNGRGADKRRMGDNPVIMNWLANMARELNPAASVVPGAGANAAQSIATEKAEIEKMMGDHTSDYWKGPKSEGLQKRYQDLLNAELRMK